MQFSGSAPAPGRDPSDERGGISIVPEKPPVRRARRWGILLFGVAVTLGCAYEWRLHAHPGGARHTTPITVPTATVTTGDLAATVRVTGTLAALNSAYLIAPRILGSRSGFNRGGDALAASAGSSTANSSSGPGPDFNLVLLHLARAGTRVKAGDVIAEFDPQNQLQRLDDYRDSAVQLDNSVKGMLATLDATREAHEQSVRSAKADWDKAILDLQTSPVRAQIDVEKMKLAVEEAEATYKQLAAEAALLEESQDSQVRISELNRDQSKIELQRAENNVRKMTIRAPMNGIVVMGSVVRNGEFGQIREGDQVFPGQPFLSVVDPASMVLNATVNQVDAEQLRLGMKALIHLDAYPDVELKGSIAGLGAMAKASVFRAGYVGEIPLRVKIDGADRHLIPDLTGGAEIVLRSESGARIAPRAAIFDEGGASVAYVRTAVGWDRRNVEIGLETFTAVAVRSGLTAGDVIALQRPF